MNNGKYSEGLIIGDLILVNYPNGLRSAIYAGEGSKNNPNFYIMNRNTLNYQLSQPLAKIYKNYITRDFKKSIAKIPLSNVDQETKDLYNDYINYLTNKQLL